MNYGNLQRVGKFLPVLAFALPLCAGTVTLSPSPLTFAKQAEGSASAPKTATLTNGTSAGITITSIAITGNFTETAGANCPVSPNKLVKGASCTIPIAFTPLSLGTLNGSLTITDSATNSPQTITLTGTGGVPVTLSPSSLTFAKLPVGETSAAQNITVTNQLNVGLSLTSILAS